MKPAVSLAKKYVAKVRQAGIPVTAAYLFGSYAKGKAKKWSDIDVCVISPIFGKSYFDEELQLKLLTTTVDDRIEPIAYAPGDLENRYSTLAHEIKTHGILLTK